MTRKAPDLKEFTQTLTEVIAVLVEEEWRNYSGQEVRVMSDDHESVGNAVHEMLEERARLWGVLFVKSIMEGSKIQEHEANKSLVTMMQKICRVSFITGFQEAKTVLEQALGTWNDDDDEGEAAEKPKD